MNMVEYLDELEVNDIKIKYDKKIYEINGDEIKTLKDFFDFIYDLFGFPKYNVYSYDAFIDWMTDDYFKWNPIIIIINNAEKFLENSISDKAVLLDLFNNDIIPYWEKKGFVFRLILELNNQPNMIMSEYLIDDISKLSIYQKENNIEEYNEFVKKTAMSNISNKYFSRPWENHIEIVYWQGFLDVLFSRGIDNIQNVMNDLLEWLDDPCRLGFAEVCDFVVQNKNQFMPLLKRKIIHEFYNKEFQYVIHLVLVYNKCSNLPKDIDSIVNKMDEFDIEGIDEDRMVEYGNELENILLFRVTQLQNKSGEKNNGKQ